jgi:hypothetical protein
MTRSLRCPACPGPSWKQHPDPGAVLPLRAPHGKIPSQRGCGTRYAGASAESCGVDPSDPIVTTSAYISRLVPAVPLA